MLHVGLTGAVASGKSTVSRLLCAREIPVIDADRVAHELYVPGSDLVEALVAEFGRDILNKGGGVDRPALATRVFGKPQRLAKLGEIVHPPLLAELAARLDALEAGGERLAVLEAALLLGWGPLSFIDLIIGVISPRAVRRRRLVDAGWSAEIADARLDAQVGDEELRRGADILIENDGDLVSLGDRVEAVIQELQRRVGASD